MAPSQDDAHAAAGSFFPGGGAAKGPERAPLLGGVSLLTTTTPPPMSNYIIQNRKFPEGVGHTLRSSVEAQREAQHGLLEDAEGTTGVDNESCCGVEQSAYKVLATYICIIIYVCR